MTKRLRHFLTVLIAILFLGPSFIQFLDVSIHHHDHFSCTAKHEHHLHVYHKKCEISTFELSHFYVKDTVSQPGSEFSTGELILLFQSNNFTDRSAYSFLLRAPPVLTLS